MGGGKKKSRFQRNEAFFKNAGAQDGDGAGAVADPPQKPKPPQGFRYECAPPAEGEAARKKHVGFVYDPDMMLHKGPADHPEQPGRLGAIFDRLRETGSIEKLHHVRSREASDEEILLWLFEKAGQRIKNYFPAKWGPNGIAVTGQMGINPQRGDVFSPCSEG